MILQALVSFYDRMSHESPDDVPAFGYAVSSVTRCIVLDNDGSLVQVLSLMDEREFTEKKGKIIKKLFPKRLMTPQQPKRSGKKPEPAFLCENAEFIFGIHHDKAGAAYRFEASRQLHERVLKNVDDEGARAVLAFFVKRRPGSLDYENVNTELLKESGNVVFMLLGDISYIHERPLVRAVWEKYFLSKSASASIGQCLVTGEKAPIARIHGNLDGFGQDKPTLVGFNQNSFVSYGKEQGDNAPVSEIAAFKYVTALNMLITDRTHSMNIHGEKLLFWADRHAPVEEAVVFQLIKGAPAQPTSQLDAVATRRVASIVKHLYDGTNPETLELNTNIRMFVLGISANKTRVVVRYFYTNSFGQMVERLQCHHRDIHMEGPIWEPEHPSFEQIMLETAVRRESKSVPAPHQVALVRSVMNGTAYPRSIFMAMLIRIRAESAANAKAAINRTRVGFIKGYLNRLTCVENKKEWIDMSLNEGEPSIPYQLGRIFAILNKAQSDAIEKVNASIVDKYLNAALASPQQVFPSLLANSEHHFSKSKKFYTRKLLLEAMQNVSAEGFPKTLNAEGQGQFMVGFYHQQQVFFRGKEQETNTEQQQNLLEDDKIDHKTGGEQA